MRPAQAAFATLDDRELVFRARQGEPGAFRAIMRRNNRRLYRIARSVVQDDSEAEDVLQEAYVRAFTAMGESQGNMGVALADVNDVRAVDDPIAEVTGSGLKAGLRLPGLYYIARTIRLDRAFLVRRGVPAFHGPSVALNQSRAA